MRAFNSFVFGLVLHSVCHGIEKIPLNIDLGLTYNIVNQKGVYGEIIYKNIYAAQFQFFNFGEFQGLFPKTENEPYERYSFVGSNFGAYLKNEHVKLGAFTGLGNLSGTVRGDFIRQDLPDCFAFCFDNTTRNYYQNISLNDFAIPFKLTLGLFFKNFGISFDENVFFVKNQQLSNFSLNFEFGNL